MKKTPAKAALPELDVKPGAAGGKREKGPKGLKGQKGPKETKGRKPGSSSGAETGAGTTASGEAGAGEETADAVAEALAWLREVAREEVRAGMSRFGIPADHALGVSVGEIQKFAKPLGRDQALSTALWATGVYEARHLAVFVGDPAALSPEEMDRWCADFDNWAVCDAACFHLFDRSPHAFSKVTQWAAESGEFQKRAGFALLAGMALHHPKAADAEFPAFLPLIEACSGDERNFVKKAVNWALRAIGGRSAALHAAALETAARLAASSSPAARWNGKDALRQLNSPATLKRLESRAKPKPKSKSKT